jgi:hypothetical protein
MYTVKKIEYLKIYLFQKFYFYFSYNIMYKTIYMSGHHIYYKSKNKI